MTVPVRDISGGWKTGWRSVGRVALSLKKKKLFSTQRREDFLRVMGDKKWNKTKEERRK